MSLKIVKHCSTSKYKYRDLKCRNFYVVDAIQLKPRCPSHRKLYLHLTSKLSDVLLY